MSLSLPDNHILAILDDYNVVGNLSKLARNHTAPWTSFHLLLVRRSQMRPLPGGDRSFALLCYRNTFILNKESFIRNPQRNKHTPSSPIRELDQFQKESRYLGLVGDGIAWTVSRDHFGCRMHLSTLTCIDRSYYGSRIQLKTHDCIPASNAQ